MSGGECSLQVTIDGNQLHTAESHPFLVQGPGIPHVRIPMQPIRQPGTRKGARHQGIRKAVQRRVIQDTKCYPKSK